jgi:hypothetical protein
MRLTLADRHSRSYSQRHARDRDRTAVPAIPDPYRRYSTSWRERAKAPITLLARNNGFGPTRFSSSVNQNCTIPE